MGCCCCCMAKPPKYAESNLGRQLTRFCRKGTMHLQIANEDRLAFERLRVMVYAAKDPLTLSVFDLALFCSMAMECGKLHELHARVREADAEGPQRPRAVRDFRVLANKCQYRFVGGAGGFSQLVTFAALTNCQFLLLFEHDPTKPARKFQFCNSAVYMMDERGYDDPLALKNEKGEEVSLPATNGIPTGVGEDIQFPKLRFKDGTYRHVEGRNIKVETLDYGTAFHFQKWLEYARSFRSSMELCMPGGNVLKAAIGLLMMFESKEE